MSLCNTITLKFTSIITVTVNNCVTLNSYYCQITVKTLFHFLYYFIIGLLKMSLDLLYIYLTIN